MGVVTAEIVEDNWQVTIEELINVAGVVCGTSVAARPVTVIADP